MHRTKLHGFKYIHTNDANDNEPLAAADVGKHFVQALYFSI